MDYGSPDLKPLLTLEKVVSDLAHPSVWGIWLFPCMMHGTTACINMNVRLLSRTSHCWYFFSLSLCKSLQSLCILLSAVAAQSAAGKRTRLVIKEPEDCEHAPVWECSKKSYLCFSCPKPLVSNLPHSMCRCVWVWNTLSLHGTDSTLFLPKGRRKCLAWFGTIFWNPSTYKADSKEENKAQCCSERPAALCAPWHHHFVDVSNYVTIQTQVDVTTLRWLWCLQGDTDKSLYKELYFQQN